MSNPSILVTAASGQLGQLVVDELLRRGPAERIAVTTRRPDAAEAFRARGLRAHVAEFDAPDALAAACEGVERVLLISGSELGRRVAQHRNVITAAKRAGVRLMAYTSVLHADVSRLDVAVDHRQTEADLAASGLPAVLLRNGWYTENLAMGIGPALAHGVILGSSGAGRIASAARIDYAVAAAEVLTAADMTGRIYELAGDASYTRAELAAEVARQSGRPVTYQDIPEVELRQALQQAGLPAPVAALVAQSDAVAADGALDDRSGTLGRLIGRPTTPMPATVAAFLAAGA